MRAGGLAGRLCRPPFRHRRSLSPSYFLACRVGRSVGIFPALRGVRSAVFFYLAAAAIRQGRFFGLLSWSFGREGFLACLVGRSAGIFPAFRGVRSAVFFYLAAAAIRQGRFLGLLSWSFGREGFLACLVGRSAGIFPALRGVRSAGIFYLAAAAIRQGRFLGLLSWSFGREDFWDCRIGRSAGFSGLWSCYSTARRGGRWRSGAASMAASGGFGVCHSGALGGKLFVLRRAGAPGVPSDLLINLGKRGGCWKPADFRSAYLAEKVSLLRFRILAVRVRLFTTRRGCA